jgi:anti-anti-sigma factor
VKSFLVEVGLEAGAIVIGPVGELDVAGGPVLERAVQNAAHGRDSPVILDLERVTFMDAAGLRAVIRASQALGGRLVVRSARSEVLRVLVITGADRRLRLEHGYSSASSGDPGASNVAYGGCGTHFRAA